MTKFKRAVSEKEKKLIDIISDAKNKLAILQEKQKIELGDLAYKNGLNEFNLNVLDDEFKKLYATLMKKNDH
jgi:hypothetical protein